MKRRNFFKSLARTAAIIALAPQLAFRVKPKIPSVPVPGAQVLAVYDMFKDGAKVGTIGWGRISLDEHLSYRRRLKTDYELTVRILEIYNNEADMRPLVLRGAYDDNTLWERLSSPS